MKNDKKITRFFATLRMTSKRTAFTLAELPEAGQHGSKHELSAVAKVVPEAGQHGSKHELSAVAKVVPKAGQLKVWIATLTTFARNDRKRAAFTLAEVLITLGIIGFVVAMTIPTLMKNYQTRVLDMQFKKAYSTLSQALNMARVGYNYEPVCYYKSDGVGVYSSMTGNAHTRDCEEFMSNFYNSLKISKYCPNKAFKNGCIPEYEGYDTVIDIKYPDRTAPEGYSSFGEYASKGCGYFRKNEIKNKRPAYVLQNGTILLPYANAFPIFAVDINGMQGPNKWGYDLFSLTIYFDGNSLYLGDGGCYAIEKGGRTTASMIENVVRK